MPYNEKSLFYEHTLRYVEDVGDFKVACNLQGNRKLHLGIQTMIAAKGLNSIQDYISSKIARFHCLSYKVGLAKSCTNYKICMNSRLVCGSRVRQHVAWGSSHHWAGIFFCLQVI